MPMLQINLPDSLKEFVATQAAAEGYASAGDYLLALLRQAQRARQKVELEAKLLAGIESLARGEGRPMTAADWDRLRATIRERYGEGEDEGAEP